MISEQLRVSTRTGLVILQLAIITLALTGLCQGQSARNRRHSIDKQPFGKTGDGVAVDIYTLKNANGVEARITTYGGIVVSLKVPDRNGKFDDVVLGYDNLDGYLKNNGPYMGALIGRYANRIARGTFKLNGVEYHLAVNNGPNHLHGGLKGFDKVVWTGKALRVANGAALKLTYQSKDGEENYPGNLSAAVIYTLTDANELKIDYSATTDKRTVVNLTSHSYFNLAGQGNGDILKQRLMINANRFTPTDSGSIPTGELRRVQGTPFDFTRPTEIGARIDQDDEQIKFGNGYDHNFVLNKQGKLLTLAAKAYEPTTGRVMQVYTTEPGIQFYAGNFLDGSITGKEGKVYNRRYGFCLEAQHFPDSPNQPKFPSVVLSPGQRYTQTTIYKFSAK
jgi:aldose 1-epimerase